MTAPESQGPDARQSTDVEFLWPANRLPISVLLDDPTPLRNPLWYEYPDAGHVAEIPNSFVERFADICDRTGAAGKFSVVPCPGAQGRIDQEIPGVSQEDLHTFIRIVTTRIAPRWDISPELMTHNRAVDLNTMAPLAEREDAWGAHQTEATLTPYISAALQILQNVGLKPNGVTSPWEFGKEVEDAYRNAIVTALRTVSGVNKGWYFLHADGASPAVPPRVVRLDSAKGTSLVSLISASEDLEGGWDDFAWRTMGGEPALVDELMSMDGKRGRLANLYSNGSPMLFHTHWQSLFSNGTGAGLDAFQTLAERVNAVWGKRVRWMSAREIAAYCTARASTTGVDSDSGVVLAAPFGCPEFTVSLPRREGRDVLLADGQRLPEVPVDEFQEGTWSPRGNRALICVDLHDRLELRWS